MAEANTEATTADNGATTAAAGSIFDAAAAAGTEVAKTTEGHPATQAPPAKADGRPDGLADEFWDAERSAVKMDALIKSQRDLRSMVARGEHKPPPTIEGYALPKVDGAPEVKADDPVWRQVREAALARGMPAAELAAIATPFFQAAAAAMKDAQPAETPEQAKAAQETALAGELAKLGPTGPALLSSLATWLNGLEARGQLTAADKTALRGISDAAGVRALAKLRGIAGGEPMPLDAVAEGEMTQAEAERLMQEAYAKNDDAMKSRARAVLERLEKAGRITGRFARAS